MILTIGVDRFERSSIVDISARLPLDRPEIPGWSSGSPPFGSQHRFQRRSKPRGSRKTNELRDTIAIRMILGLALVLALFFVSSTMSFWQANAGQNKIDNIIENLEPKRDIAFAMELNAVETEKNVLEYLRNPDPALRAQITETSAENNRLKMEFLSLASPEEIAKLANLPEIVSGRFIDRSTTLMDQSDIKQALSKSLEQDFAALNNLVDINIREQPELYKAYGPDKLIQLQILETAMAEINHAVESYLRIANPILRQQISEDFREFYIASADFNRSASSQEERQRAESIDLLGLDSQVMVTGLLDSKDSLDENLAAFLSQRSELDGNMNQLVLVPVQQLFQTNNALHSIDSQTTRVTLILLAIGLVFVFGGALFVFKRVTNPVSELVAATKKVAEGDLSTRVESTSKDEIGLLGTAFNEMIAKREAAERALVLSEETQRKLANENSHNASIGRIVNSSMDLKDVYDAFAEEVRSLVHFDWLAISLIDHASQTQRIDYVSAQKVPQLRQGTSLRLKGTLVGAIAEHRNYQAETFSSRDGIDGKYPSVGPIASAGLRSVLGVPLVSRNLMIGALVFASDEETPYSESEIVAAGNVADQVAGAIGNAPVYAERQEAQTQLLRAHHELENRVLERTLELEKTRDIALEATIAKSQFLANMSHELRTPLNAVIGYSELLIDEARDEDNTAIIPDLERITVSGKHLLKLISDILDLAKVEAGKMELSVEDFNLSNTVEEVQVVCEALVHANKNSLAVTCPADIGYMRTDPIKIRQILFNLLSNASKFTENGSINLNVAREIRDGVDWIIFTVTDTGIGMTPSVTGKVFDAFTQADSPTVRKYGGTGLGLNLCRTFTEMMGGSITVESLLGSGSTFVCSVPATVKEPVSKPIYPVGPVDVATILVEADAAEVRQRAEVWMRQFQSVPQ